MFSTTEVRWFYQGAVPPTVWQWFAAPNREISAQPPRIDYYLRIVDGDGLGIKLREGRIEVKQRYDQQGTVHFGDRVAGKVEQWRKWSFPLAEAEHMMAELDEGLSSWVGVYKEREVRTLQMIDGAVVDVSGTVFLDHGCGWEVAQVRLETTNALWWSVGFEAFGEEAVRGEMIGAIAGHILAMDNAPVLELKDSCGYPKWLQVVI